MRAYRRFRKFILLLIQNSIWRGNETIDCSPGADTSLVVAGGALAQGKLDKVVKVGSLGDNRSLRDIGGPGSSAAAQMAIEDSGLLAKGWKIDLISADHQNKPDVGVNIGKQWIDVEKVDVFVRSC